MRRACTLLMAALCCGAVQGPPRALRPSQAVASRAAAPVTPPVAQPPAPPQSGPSLAAAPPAPAPATAPPQFPPRGTGLTAEDRTVLQTAVDHLARQVAALHQRYDAGPLRPRIADVEVYLDAVRRPLKYDERLYAARNSTPLATALETLAAGSARATRLEAGETPWTVQSGVRGFYSRLDGSAQPYLLTLPENYDPAARREYRLDIFMHGRDDQVLEQQFMAKSLTGYTSKPLGPGPDRFMLQPYGRYTNASRFAGETDGLEALDAVMAAYPIDRDRIVMTGFSMGGASAWSYAVHYADRWAAAAPGAGFTETAVFLRGALATPAAELRPADAVAPVRLDRLRAQHVQRPGRRLLGGHRRAEAGG